MSLVVLTFMIGVLNLCLGYGLAVYLGYGPPSLLDAWEALGPRRRPAAPDEVEIQGLVDDLAATSLTGMLDDLAEESLDFQPLDQPYDEDVAELLSPTDPENWDLNEKYVETSILKLNIAMMKSGARAAEIDTRLRAAQGHSDAETIRECVVALKEDCETYLAQQRDVAEQFTARISEMGELRSLGEEIEMANLEQAAQIETTLSNLEHMDFESDVEAACHRLLEEINNLRVARHRLRDNQETAFLAVARYEGRLDKIERQLYIDPLTKLRNRIGLETTLFDWWQQGRQKSQQINGVLLDVDAFTRVNEKHGPALGDRVLYQLAQVIHEAGAKSDLVGRFAGEAFLLMMVDVGPRTAVKNAEHLRQSIEKIAFRHGEESIHLTVAAAITEVKPEDSDEAVLRRLADTMKLAKRQGPNRSFFHDGSKTEAVEAPNLGAKDVEIRI
jgi:diguanylate cyclase (GGDEF)-like protein